MWEEFAREVDAPFRRVGSLVLSFTKRDDEELDKLVKNAEKNEVYVERWDADRVLNDQIHVTVGVRSALFCPSAGITSPYLYTIALAESAIMNGVKFEFGTEYVSAKYDEAKGCYAIDVRSPGRCGVVVESRTILARHVIASAGINADEIFLAHGGGSSGETETLVGAGITINPRKGEYVLLAREQGHMVSRVLFQAPTAKYGKGVLVSPTVDGNLLLGPSANDVPSKTDKSTTIEEMAYVTWAARRSVPHLDTREAIRSFAGIRAKSSTGDFVVRPAGPRGTFLHIAGIDSPGLTASPALSAYALTFFSNFLSRFRNKEITGDEFKVRGDYLAGGAATVGGEPAASKTICKCEGISEAKIRASCRRGIALTHPDSVKWRTRAGMGRCQGVRCRPLVEEIIEDEAAKHFNTGEKETEDPTTLKLKEESRILKGLLSKL